jgi:hypothetical protein
MRLDTNDADDEAYRYSHQELVSYALWAANLALHSAEFRSRRQDCLRSAVQSLEGALKNVVHEDAEVKP